MKFLKAVCSSFALVEIQQIIVKDLVKIVKKKQNLLIEYELRKYLFTLQNILPEFPTQRNSNIFNKS